MTCAQIDPIEAAAEEQNKKEVLKAVLDAIKKKADDVKNKDNKDAHSDAGPNK